MAWPHESETTGGNALAAFQTACQAAGIPTQGLDQVSAMQLALANVLSLLTASGGFQPVTAITFSNPPSAVTFTMGMGNDDFGIFNNATAQNALLLNGVTDEATLRGLILAGAGGGTGVVSVGAADSGGSGYRLLRVPN